MARGHCRIVSGPLTVHHEEVKVQSLIAELRSWLEDVPRSGEILPEGTLQSAAHHRADGFLYHIGTALCESDSSAAQKAWSRNLAGHLARTSFFEALWPKNAPPPLVIKGADLAENLFDDPGARRCVDLDILLPEPEFSVVMNAITDHVEVSERARHERFESDADYAVGFRRDGVLIEIHRALQPMHRSILDPSALYARGQRGVLGSQDVLYPAIQDRLKIWLVNHSKTGFRTDLADLIDLSLILDSMEANAVLDQAIDDMSSMPSLHRAFDLALHQFDASGLMPTRFRRLKNNRHRIMRALASVPAHQNSNFSREQCTKLWLATPAQRAGTLARAISTIFRSGQSGRRPG